MPVRNIDDGSGEYIRVLDIDGFFAPSFDTVPNHEKEVRRIPEWKCRPDDIFVCAYPKAGENLIIIVHWKKQIVKLINT